MVAKSVLPHCAFSCYFHVDLIVFNVMILECFISRDALFIILVQKESEEGLTRFWPLGVLVNKLTMMIDLTVFSLF